MSQDNIKKTKSNPGKNLNHSNIINMKNNYKNNKYQIQHLYQNNTDRYKVPVTNVYVKPRLMSYNSSNYKTPTASGCDNNLNKAPNTENVK